MVPIVSHRGVRSGFTWDDFMVGCAYQSSWTVQWMGSRAGRAVPLVQWWLVRPTRWPQGVPHIMSRILAKQKERHRDAIVIRRRRGISVSWAWALILSPLDSYIATSTGMGRKTCIASGKQRESLYVLHRVCMCKIYVCRQRTSPNRWWELGALWSEGFLPLDQLESKMIQ